jgi:hypothetical protein
MGDVSTNRVCHGIMIFKHPAQRLILIVATVNTIMIIANPTVVIWALPKL